MSSGPAAALLCVLATLVAARASAHPAPATPPEFLPGNCITVIDTRETQALELAYDVAFDDNVFALGEIQLPDGKSHQFFAFDGVVGRLAASGGYQLFPFDAAIERPLALPLWLDQDDVDRAAAAASPTDMTGFTAAEVAAGDVLAARSDLATHVHAFGDKTTRVPITQQQAQKGVRWDLRALRPGLYTVAGYVFSPPYNDWAARFGVIKVVDGESSVPAAAIEPIDTVLFAGRGRRVKGCVDAPGESTLSAWVRSEELPDAPWESWLKREPLSALGKAGGFELCFMNQEPARAGMLRVRVEVTTPDGRRSAAYSPDTLLAVATQAACVESEDTCCAASPAPAAAETGDAGRPSQVSAAADAAAAAGGEEAEPEPPAPSTVTESRRGGGCSVRAGERRGALWLALALLCAVAVRSRRCPVSHAISGLPEFRKLCSRERHILAPVITADREERHEEVRSAG
jgi:hypothetical protein